MPQRHSRKKCCLLLLRLPFYVLNILCNFRISLIMRHPILAIIWAVSNAWAHTIHKSIIAQIMHYIHRNPAQIHTVPIPTKWWRPIHVIAKWMQWMAMVTRVICHAVSIKMMWLLSHHHYQHQKWAQWNWRRRITATVYQMISRKSHSWTTMVILKRKNRAHRHRPHIHTAPTQGVAIVIWIHSIWIPLNIISLNESIIAMAAQIATRLIIAVAAPTTTNHNRTARDHIGKWPVHNMRIEC